MHRLSTLMLWRATSATLAVASNPGPLSLSNTQKKESRKKRGKTATLADTLQAMVRVPTRTLVVLNLSHSRFSPPAMTALSALLEHSTSLFSLDLEKCDLTDDLASLLAIGLHHPLPALRTVVLQGNPLLRKWSRGREALEECMATNTRMWLYY